MKIRQRDLNLAYKPAIKMDMVMLVLDWLLEFRFSSIDLLARRLGSRADFMYGFFNRILKQDCFIQKFNNVHTGYDRYVILTSKGLSILKENNRDTSSSVTESSKLSRYSRIVHDISVQYAILNRLDDYTEVISENNLRSLKTQRRPDALLINDSIRLALEYERWRKERKRIYISFHQHVQSMMGIDKNQTTWDRVCYIFDQSIDYDHYVKLFSQDEWPTYAWNRKNNAFRLVGNYQLEKEIRTRFDFKLESRDEPF